MILIELKLLKQVCYKVNAINRYKQFDYYFSLFLYLIIILFIVKWTGLVTTTRVTHATPSAVYSYSPSRYYESFAPAGCTRGDIATQLVNSDLRVSYIIETQRCQIIDYSKHLFINNNKYILF